MGIKARATRSQGKWKPQPIALPIPDRTLRQLGNWAELKTEVSAASARAAQLVGTTRLWYALFRLERTSLSEEVQSAISRENVRVRRAYRSAAERLKEIRRNLPGAASSRLPEGHDKVVRAIDDIADQLVAVRPRPLKFEARRTGPWVDVMDDLIEGGMTLGEIADVVLDSRSDWKHLPCPQFVEENYGEPVHAGDVPRDRLKTNLRTMASRESKLRNEARRLYRTLLEPAGTE